MAWAGVFPTKPIKAPSPDPLSRPISRLCAPTPGSIQCLGGLSRFPCLGLIAGAAYADFVDVNRHSRCFPRRKAGGWNVAPICITDIAAIREFTRGFDPTHVVHCAGVCDLDVCEERPEWARALTLNAGGAETVVSLFGTSAHILFLSTDLVYSGDAPPAGGYTETHVPDPVSIAGKTFTQAEQAIGAAARGPRSVSLYELRMQVVGQGNYPRHLLRGIYRHEEIGGPPRIGNVSLDIRRIRRVLDRYS